ncbi:hypothetical protein FB45DRAFT_925935 [Roridomyces roridus]|uniref:Uncharacterized protein n=1 Tax=Roridomyces roridus TaxID=1738132 RepID=A0AAD7BKQ6_9AGAR|nr:hypothetical protein FB45DRAFT_925935 [Roridomyces roridus]
MVSPRYQRQSSQDWGTSRPWLWAIKSRLGRRQQFACVALAFLTFLTLTGLAHQHVTTTPHSSSSASSADSPSAPSKLPPPSNWEAVLKWEAALPQHDPSLPFPEGRTGRYVRFSNQAKGLGWNNCLNEELMNLHIAYLTGRSYVFMPYIWAPHHYPWPENQWLRPTFNGPSTPLTAIVSGPLAGGPWEEGDSAPRSVSTDYWEKVCPPDERVLVDTTAVKPALSELPGDKVLQAWVDLLRPSSTLASWNELLSKELQHVGDARCVEIVPPHYTVDFYPQVIDLWLWGDQRVLPLWPLFSSSPASRLLAPSPVVMAALSRNAYLFPQTPASIHSARPSPGYAHDPVIPYDRILAVHIRRGDYVPHCPNLAEWGSQYYSWAQLPFLPDHFKRSEGDKDVVLRHCLPTAEQLAERIATARAEYVAAGDKKDGERKVDVLYLLTNEFESDYLTEVLSLVSASSHWTVVRSTRDLVLDAEQIEVAMVADMEIARRAAVFMGNGWSSYTSNIIHQRLVDGKEPISIRMT